MYHMAMMRIFYLDNRLQTIDDDGSQETRESRQWTSKDKSEVGRGGRQSYFLSTWSVCEPGPGT
jgi:hypothetical protein